MKTGRKYPRGSGPILRRILLYNLAIVREYPLRRVQAMNEDRAQSQLWVQRFLFNAPLYAPNEISFAGATALFVDHFRIEGYCPYCKNTSFFSRCRGTKGIASVQALLDAQELCQLEIVCMRDVRHSIFFFLHLSKARIQKAGQYPSPKELGAAQPGLGSPLKKIQNALANCLQQSIVLVERGSKWSIQQFGRLFSSSKTTTSKISDAVESGRTRLLGNIREKWGSSFGGSGIPVTLIVAVVCLLTLFQQARREAEFRQTIQQVVQRADDHATAEQAAKSRIDGLERQLDEKFDVLSKNLDTVRRSITQNDALVAVVNSRLDSSDPSAKSDPLPRPSGASQSAEKPAATAMRQDSVDPDAVDSSALDRQPATRPSATFTQIDQQPAIQSVNVVSQVGRQPVLQQAAASGQADSVPAIQAAAPPADTRQKPETASRESVGHPSAGAAPDAAAAKPNASRKTAAATPKAAPSRSGAVPHLGIGVSDSFEATGTRGRHGLMITVVDPGSPAERAGVRPHDLLLKVDHTAVSRPEQMRGALLSLKGKHTLVLTLKRDGKIEHVKLKVG